MIKQWVNKNYKIITYTLLFCILGYWILKIVILEPTEKELVGLYRNYQNNINEKIVLPQKYQNPNTVVPSYFSKDITISLTNFINRYVYDGSKLKDQEIEKYETFVDSQIFKNQMILGYEQKIDKVVEFDYKITRANLKLIVSTNKDLLDSNGISGNKEEFYTINFRKQNGIWKIYWISREDF